MPYHQNPDGPPYMSLFSATGGMDLGLDAAGWRCIGQAEWDPWRRSVLRRHWPDIPQWPDVREVCPGGENDLPESPRLIVGGFPCQDLSLAGKRKGLEGERSGLAFEFIRIVDVVRPEWVLFENVVGLLSSNQGRDLAAILGRMAAIGRDVDGAGGYGCAFRVLDAQHFGVPQRRRRVFILCRRSDGDPAAAARSAGQVLSVGTRCSGSAHASGEERSDLFGDADGTSPVGGEGRTEPSREGAASGRVTNTLTKGATTGLGNTDIVGTMALTEAQIREPISNTLLKSIGGVNNMSVQSVANAHEAQMISTGYGRGPSAEGETSTSLTKGGGGKGAVYHQQPRHFRWGSGGSAPPSDGDVAGTLMKQEATPAIFDENDEGLGIRRFTPLECERLMGWPDDHTRWNDEGVEAPESRRYEACGDGVAAPVATWIGQRLLAKIKEEERGE